MGSVSHSNKIFFDFGRAQTFFGSGTCIASNAAEFGKYCNAAELTRTRNINVNMLSYDSIQLLVWST